ncbi:acetate non-utilizing protein 9 [Pyricularia oryzae Y34]|uniref:Succinate dehydrogenase assembly factor 3 n=2 Tax=Pyricularia oryzae TaxID=318829 RepID=A0AA97PL93_PYRO3|nr:acetate non-utilizing protein 9 [Pyricularia oryzae Y34]KAI7922355.1 acetate non-utilizing protein 9 [Pyricularia oryzae]
MRASMVRRMAAAASSSASSSLRPAPLALLPPIPLYRRLLRAHRKHLPAEMRLLGDEYLKSEFRAHRNIDNPAHLVEGESWLGEKIDQAKVEKLSEQQVGQLYELMMAIKSRREGGEGEGQESP